MTGGAITRSVDTMATTMAPSTRTQTIYNNGVITRKIPQRLGGRPGTFLFLFYHDTGKFAHIAHGADFTSIKCNYHHTCTD